MNTKYGSVLILALSLFVYLSIHFSYIYTPTKIFPIIPFGKAQNISGTLFNYYNEPITNIIIIFKDTIIVVIGGSFSGLTIAAKLSLHGYPFSNYNFFKKISIHF